MITRVHRQHGSMLFMCVITLALMLAVFALAFGVYFLFFSHRLVQNFAEDFALDAAKQLNYNDHSGKINNLLAHSRELVFSSRETYSKTLRDEEFNDLQLLAAQVLEESRNGARSVASERDRYVGQSIDGLRRSLTQAAQHSHRGVYLTNMSACDPEITDLQVGAFDNQPSNVEVSKVPDLTSYDLQQGFVRSGKEVNLYRANVNLKLPGEDADLDFMLSPLAPPVRGTTAPMRLTRGQSFKPSFILRADGKDSVGACRISPSAVQVVMKLKVKENVVGDLEASTKTINIACTNGAGMEP